MSSLLNLIIVVLSAIVIAFTMFPFSPMTLKLFMPGRGTMLFAHKNRYIMRLLGVTGLAVVLVVAIADDGTSAGWIWASGATLAISAMFWWGMYVPVIMHPPKKQRVVNARDADAFIKPNEDVLGLIVNGKARAYPREPLTRPHLTFDQVGGESMAVTYCILCNSAMAFKAELDGKPTNFRAITAYNNNIIYYDKDRGNYIQQLEGKVIDGPDAGKYLDAVPLTICSWEDWKGMYPDTDFMHIQPDSFRDSMLTWMLGWMIPLPGLAKRKKPWHPMSGRIDSRLPAMSMVVGVEVAGESRTYPLRDLREKKVVNDQVGGKPIVVMYDEAHDTAAVYSRQLSGQTLTFKPGNGSENVIATDEETGTQWAVTGTDSSSNKQLEVVPNFGKLFWFSWSTFTNTEVKSV